MSEVAVAVLVEADGVTQCEKCSGVNGIGTLGEHVSIRTGVTDWLDVVGVIGAGVCGAGDGALVGVHDVTSVCTSSASLLVTGGELRTAWKVG